MERLTLWHCRIYSIRKHKRLCAGLQNGTEFVYERSTTVTPMKGLGSNWMLQVGRRHANRTVNTEFDSGATAWLLTCIAITWLMIPGVGFFYNGMAPRKSSLVFITTCLWSCAVVSIQVRWSLYQASQ